MPNSDLYYVVHWSWNILLNVSPVAKTMEVLCLGWLAGLHQGRTQKNPFPWHSLENPNVSRSKLLCAHLGVGIPHQSILNFWGGFWKEGGTPPLPLTENLAAWAGGKPQPCLNTVLDRLGDTKLLPAGLTDLQKFLSSMGQHANSSGVTDLEDPKVPFWQGLMWKGPHLNHIKRPVTVFSVTLAHLWAYLNQKQYDFLSLLPKQSCKSGDIYKSYQKTSNPDARQCWEQLWSCSKFDLVHGYLWCFSRSCHLLPKRLCFWVSV